MCCLNLQHLHTTGGMCEAHHESPALRVRLLLDLRVSVRGGVHFDLVKRVLRDINRSGQEPEEIIQQISDTVYPMYKARGGPPACVADRTT